MNTPSAAAQTPQDDNVEPLSRKANLRHDPAALRYALDMSGLTQRELSEVVSCSESTISELLKGARNPSAALVRDMAFALNCPVVVLQAKVRLDGAA